MSSSGCSIDDCDRGGKLTRGWCNMHYLRWRTHGDPLATNKPGRKVTPEPERFWPNVAKTEDGCWLWTASTSRGGYGKFRSDGRDIGAHRWSYEALVGAIPKGLDLDHLCRVHNCVNPEHLEPVSRQENLRRRAKAQHFEAMGRTWSIADARN